MIQMHMEYLPRYTVHEALSILWRANPLPRMRHGSHDTGVLKRGVCIHELNPAVYVIICCMGFVSSAECSVQKFLLDE